MTKKLPFLLLPIFVASIVTGIVIFAHHHTIALFSPQGQIASQQRRLILIAVGLCMIVVIPVFVMLFWFAWRYRASNKKAIYRPEWSNSRIAETVWWGVPALIIGVLSIITWHTSHTLDPYRALASSQKPMTIQVVALPWRWLFIYPDQDVATVNYVAFPASRPIDFEITADAPMNSFWIPQLGGQIYAMSGMKTSLHLMADHAGEYRGLSANISGSGFADMHFVAQVQTQKDFDTWLQAAEHSGKQLNNATYGQMALPSHDTTRATYADADPQLFDDIIMKYMNPSDMDMQMNNSDIAKSNASSSAISNSNSASGSTNSNMSNMPGMTMDMSMSMPTQKASR